MVATGDENGSTWVWKAVTGQSFSTQQAPNITESAIDHAPAEPPIWRSGGQSAAQLSVQP